MALSFQTGYVDSDRQLVMELREIRTHYLKTWFLPDFIANFPVESVMELFGTSLGTNAMIFKTSRIPRILRLGRLFEIFREFKGC